MPIFKRRGLALDEGGFAFFSGLYLLLLQVAKGKLKKIKPQVWPAYKRLKKNMSSHKFNRIWFEFVGFDVRACPKHAVVVLQSPSWVNINQPGFSSLGGNKVQRHFEGEQREGRCFSGLRRGDGHRRRESAESGKRKGGIGGREGGRRRSGTG